MDTVTVWRDPWRPQQRSYVTLPLWYEVKRDRREGYALGGLLTPLGLPRLVSGLGFVALLCVLGHLRLLTNNVPLRTIPPVSTAGLVRLCSLGRLTTLLPTLKGKLAATGNS